MDMRDRPYPPVAVAKVDLQAVEDRRRMARWLREGKIHRVAPGVYAREPSHIELALVGVGDNRWAWAIAAAWARQHRPDTPLLPGRDEARHALGLGPRPDTDYGALQIGVPGLEAPTPLGVWVRLVPAPAWMAVAKGPAAGHIMVGLAGDLEGRSAEGLEQIGRQMADRLQALPQAVQDLQAAAEALPEPYDVVARIAAEVLAERAENGGLVLAAREPPHGWTPPVEPGAEWDGPIVHLWQIQVITEGRVRLERLVADRCTGHPHINPRARMWTSPLVWIDEAAGWAHTHSRLYRLGRRDTPEARAADEAEERRVAAEEHARRQAWEARRPARLAADAARQAEAMALIEASGGVEEVNAAVCIAADFYPGLPVLSGDVVPAAFLAADKGLLEGLLSAAYPWVDIEAPWSGAAWLLSPCAALDGRVPIDLLRRGSEEDMERVITASGAAVAAWCRTCAGDPEED